MRRTAPSVSKLRTALRRSADTNNSRAGHARRARRTAAHGRSRTDHRLDSPSPAVGLATMIRCQRDLERRGQCQAVCGECEGQAFERMHDVSNIVSTTRRPAREESVEEVHIGRGRGRLALGRQEHHPSRIAVQVRYRGCRRVEHGLIQRFSGLLWTVSTAIGAPAGLCERCSDTGCSAAGVWIVQAPTGTSGKHDFVTGRGRLLSSVRREAR